MTKFCQGKEIFPSLVERAEGGVGSLSLSSSFFFFS